MNEQRVEDAMSIILHAGDARVRCKEAMDAIAAADIDKAKVHLQMAQDEIVEAHKIQTEVIQGEMRGENAQYSLLFAHAQDTLMTINSEINMTKQMIHVFEQYENRISKLETYIHKDGLV